MRVALKVSPTEDAVEMSIKTYRQQTGIRNAASNWGSQNCGVMVARQLPLDWLCALGRQHTCGKKLAEHREHHAATTIQAPGVTNLCRSC